MSVPVVARKMGINCTKSPKVKPQRENQQVERRSSAAAAAVAHSCSLSRKASDSAKMPTGMMQFVSALSVLIVRNEFSSK